MINLSSITAMDWITLALGAIGGLSAIAAKKNQLPKWAQKWLKRVTPDRITEAILYADAVKTMKPEQRRVTAVEYLQKVTVKELGFPIPTSIANLLVEFAYQTYKRKVGK